MNMNISYGRTEDAWLGFEQFLTTLIDKYNLKKVCDVGGGANPLLNSEYVIKKGIDYCIIDISESELRKTSINCHKILADISSTDFSVDKRFDIAFSKMLAEHIPNAEQFHKNVLDMLTQNGLAVHFFPTLYTLPFIVNYIVPNYLAQILLKVFAPRNMHRHAKFPAYYRWCRGPIPSQIRKFIDLGFEVIEFKVLYGHEYYNRLKILKKIHDFKTNILLKRPNPYFSNYAYVILKKN